MKTAKLAIPSAHEMPTTAIQAAPRVQRPSRREQRFLRYLRRRWRASSPDGGGVTRAGAGPLSQREPGHEVPEARQSALVDGGRARSAG